MARLDDMVKRMVEPMIALGLIDHPPNTAVENTEAIARTAAHLKLAAELADKSIVLLKNEGGLLPLKIEPAAPAPTVAVFGNTWWRAGKGSGGVQYAPVAPMTDDPHTHMVAPCRPPDCNPDTAFLPHLPERHGARGGAAELRMARPRAKASREPRLGPPHRDRTCLASALLCNGGGRGGGGTARAQPADRRRCWRLGERVGRAGAGRGSARARGVLLHRGPRGRGRSRRRRGAPAQPIKQ